jgi:hypothetical protein
MPSLGEGEMDAAWHLYIYVRDGGGTVTQHLYSDCWLVGRGRGGGDSDLASWRVT